MPDGVLNGSASPSDVERLQAVTASLQRILPPELPIDSLTLQLYDQDNAGARRFGSWRQLTVGRPLIDRSVPEQLDVKLAHEIAHLQDPGLNRQALAYLVGLLSTVPLFLALAGVIAVSPAQLLMPTGLAVVAMVLAMAALSRAVEYRADRGAIALTSPEAVTRWMIDEGSGGMPSGWRGLLNTHPSPEQRAAHIAQALEGSISPRAQSSEATR